MQENSALAENRGIITINDQIVKNALNASMSIYIFLDSKKSYVF